MVEWWQLALSIAGGLAILWVALVIALLVEQRKHPGATTIRAILRLAPDVARLLKRLASDRSVPISVRIALFALLAYLLSPIDLIPDFIPVIGFVDDALIVALALRFATRHAGGEAIERHWPGTPEGLAAVLRLAGLIPRSPM